MKANIKQFINIKENELELYAMKIARIVLLEGLVKF